MEQVRWTSEQSQEEGSAVEWDAEKALAEDALPAMEFKHQQKNCLKDKRPYLKKR